MVLRVVVSTRLTDDAVSALVLAVVVELCGSGQEDSLAIEHESINQYWAAVRIHIDFHETLPENNNISPLAAALQRCALLCHCCHEMRQLVA